MNGLPDDVCGQEIELSEDGARRREEILARAQGALAARTVRRRMVRAASAGTAVILLVMLVTAGIQWMQRSAPVTVPMVADRGMLPDATEVGAPESVHEVPVEGTSRMRVVILRDDPRVVSRLRAAEDVVLTRGVDDGELLAILRTAGRAEGLIRIEGRVMLSSEVRAAAKEGPGGGRG